MIRIEYQLTFDEFREAMVLARRQLAHKLRGGKPGSGASVALLAWCLLVACVLALLMMLTSGGLIRALGESWRAHVGWAIALVLTLVLILLLARRQFNAQVRQMWESMATLQQVRTVQFDEDGVATIDALVQSRLRWGVYRRLEETPRLFLLFWSDYTFEIYPKRAFTEASMGQLRELFQSKLAERTRAFAVLPAATSQPLPPPPLSPERSAP